MKVQFGEVEQLDGKKTKSFTCDSVHIWVIQFGLHTVSEGQWPGYNEHGYTVKQNK